MIHTGSFIRYSDPRIPELLIGRRMHVQHVQLLSGQLSWSKSAWPNDDFRILQSLTDFVTRLDGFSLDLSLVESQEIARISAELPPQDSLTLRYVEHFELWHLKHYGIKIITIEPFCVHLGVPIFKGTLFGEFFERETGLVRGIASDMYVVGQMDVQHVIDDDVTYDENGRPAIVRGVKREGEVVEGGSHRVRTTLRKAKYTARMVAQCVPAWTEFKRAREAKVAESSEERFVESYVEIDDEESDFIKEALGQS